MNIKPVNFFDKFQNHKLKEVQDTLNDLCAIHPTHRNPAWELRYSELCKIEKEEMQKLNIIA